MKNIDLSKLITLAILSDNDHERLSCLSRANARMKSEGVHPSEIVVSNKHAASAAIVESASLREQNEKLVLAIQVYIDGLDRIAATLTKANKDFGKATEKPKGQTKVNMKTAVRSAGISGLTRDEIRQTDPGNKGITKRISELITEGTFFEVGDRFVHVAFADKYHDLYRVAEKKRQEKIKR